MDDSGNIQSYYIDKGVNQLIDFIETQNDNEDTLNKKHLIIFNIVLIILSIIGYTICGNYGLIFGALIFSVFVSSDLFEFINDSIKIKKEDEKECSTAKFHAAEHMVLNAYEKLKRIPTLAEAKKFSRFSRMCGSRTTISKITMFTLSSIVISCILQYNKIIYSLVMFAIIMFVILLERWGGLTFFQVFLTSTPTEKEIKLAIESLKQLEILENKLENEKEFSFTMKLPENFMPIFIFEQRE